MKAEPSQLIVKFAAHREHRDFNCCTLAKTLFFKSL